MTNNNIKIDSKDFGRAALAWKSPDLIQVVGHEARSTVWMGVILLGLFSSLAYLFTIPSSNNGSSNQEISDYRQAMIRQCAAVLVARGYNQYNNNNCFAVADSKTYQRYGRMPY